MAFSEYCERFHHAVDVGSLDERIIGRWNYRQIFPEAILFIPSVYRDIFDEVYGSFLPQNHLLFWYQDKETFWTCRYCNFWSQNFNQRVMEDHLILECEEVIIFYPYSNLFQISHHDKDKLKNAVIEQCNIQLNRFQSH